MRLNVMYSFEIQGRLDGLNEYTRACRGNKFSGATMKKKNEWKCIEAMRDATSKPAKPLEKFSITFDWHEAANRGKRRDPDNISFAKKFILDAMQKEGWIENDDFNHLESIQDDFLPAEEGKEFIKVVVWRE